MAQVSLVEKLKAMNPGGAYRAVGRVKDAHGLKGEIWVVLFAGHADWLEELRETGGFLLSGSEEVTSEDDLQNDVTEFTLKGAKPHKNGIILQSPQLTDRTAAEKLRGKFLIIPDSYLEADAGEEFYLSEVEGFQVLEGETAIGKVVGFTSNVAQDLLIVSLANDARPGVKEGDKIDIPFVEAIVVGVDAEAESLEVELPPGLIEVQLGLDRDEPGESEELEESEDLDAESDAEIDDESSDDDR